MKVNWEWEGVMPAITTKFTDDDKLDLKMFNKNIKAQMDAVVHGIVLGGSLGEASTLAENEKEVLIKETLQTVMGKIPVVMTIAEQATKAAIKAAQNAEKNGADALMILPPMRYCKTIIH